MQYHALAATVFLADCFCWAWCLAETFMYRPFVVWMVAPVVMPISCPGVSSASNWWRITATAMTASMRANWSPTHFLGPPLNGMYLQHQNVSYIFNDAWTPWHLLWLDSPTLHSCTSCQAHAQTDSRSLPCPVPSCAWAHTALNTHSFAGKREPEQQQWTDL